MEEPIVVANADCIIDEGVRLPRRSEDADHQDHSPGAREDAPESPSPAAPAQEEDIIIDVDTVEMRLSNLSPAVPMVFGMQSGEVGVPHSPGTAGSIKEEAPSPAPAMPEAPEEAARAPTPDAPSPAAMVADGEVALENENPTQPLRLTNFSISEILKPEFGPKNKDIKPWRPSPTNCDSLCRSLHAGRKGSDECKTVAGRQDTLSPHYRLAVEAGAGKRPGPAGEAPAPPSPAHHPSQMVWPAWVYCTRYSDRPSSGPRSRKIKRKEKTPEEKRPRTAFTNEQLQKLREEFEENRYLTEERRQRLAKHLDLNESQIKIWFQNKRAKMKKASGVKNTLAMQLMAQGLYQHSTCVPSE